MRLIQRLFGLVAIIIGVCLAVGAISSHLAGHTGAMWFMGLTSLVFGWTGLKWLHGQTDTTWRSDPATAKQKSFADELGIRYPKNISKGDLSDLISEATGK